MKRIYNLPELKQRRKKLRNELTPQELILWSILKDKELGVKFRRQHSIGPYIVDFYCPFNKLVIEIDGIQHQENTDYDLERTNFLNDYGCEVLRFWNNEINIQLDSVIMEIRSKLKS